MTSRVHHSSVAFSHRSSSFLCFMVSFSQKRGFPLKAGGRPAILAAKTWQYLLKYGCGVRFAFCCYLLFFVASLFALFPSLHSRRPSLCITFSPTLSLHHKTRSPSPKYRRGESEWITKSRSPKHRRGESEWIPRSTPNGFAYVFNFALNMPW